MRSIFGRGLLLAIIAGVTAGSLAARADDCKTAVGHERSAAEKQAKQGDVKGALKRLDDVLARCDKDPQLPAETRLWLISDLSLLAHRAGDDAHCLDVLGQLDVDVVARYPKAGKALLYNAGVCAPPKEGCDYKLDQDPSCQLQLALEYSKRNDATGYGTPKCALPGHGDALALPDGTCLMLTGFVRKGKEDDYDAECPQIFRLTAKGRRAVAIVTPSWMTDPSSCCGMKTLSLRQDGDKTQIIVASDGLTRDCFGGTATEDYFTRLELEGNTLKVTQDDTIGFH